VTATAADPLVASLVEDVAELHRSFATALHDVTDDALRRRPGALAPSIGFHLWHIARWADLFQARFPGFAAGLARLGPNEQIWERDELAGAWGLTAALGRHETGWGLDDDASASLPLPSKDRLIAYASAAFEAATTVFSGLHDGELLDPTRNIYDADEDWIVLDHFHWYRGHGARHLGMIEALKGVLGMRGTATS
jgi:DinB superfamily